jgi:transcriptional regulator with XRE-family HTH domain
MMTRSSLPPLRAVRIAHGLSLRETARRAGITPAHLSRVERGERQLSVDALLRLAGVLGLNELAKLLAPYGEAS